MGFLYLGWKGAVAPLIAKPAGWGLIIFGGVFAIDAWGAEFGPIYVLSLLACAAWLCVGFEAEPWQPKAEAVRTDWPRPQAAAWARHGVLFVFAVVVGGLASIFATILVSHWLPGQVVDRMAFVMLMTPVLWGGAMFWTLYDPRKAKPAVSIVCLATGFLLVAL